MTNQIIVTQQQSITTPTGLDFDTLVGMVGRTVSQTSARQYMSDLVAWEVFAGESADMPNFANVGAYVETLDAAGASTSVIRRRVAAIRKLAQVAAALDYTNDKRRGALESLNLLKVKGKGIKSKRAKVALSPAQATRAIEAWHGDKPMERRNRAIIALLLSTGLRRSELAALKWSDLDLDKGTVHVAHGKGDKERTSPIAGTLAIEALKAWREAQQVGRAYVFCHVRKGGNLGADAPINAQVVYRVCNATSERTGEAFKPHDLRRTFITELIETGTPVPTVADIVGHSDKSTTYLYAQSNEAAQQRENIRLRYG